jgi:alpha-amylase
MWQRYQPVSYNLDSRSGSRAQFKDMVERCNRVGVRVYVDAVINHMAGMDRQGTGSGGSSFNTMDGNHDFPAVPYSDKDFTPADLCPSGCGCVDNYGDPNIVRNCYLVGLSDLYGATDYVRDRVAEYFNDLIDLGVASGWMQPSTCGLRTLQGSSPVSIAFPRGMGLRRVARPSSTTR